MAILAGSGKRLSTDDGIPYMWQSGDVYTEPTSVGIGSTTSSNGTSDDAFGFSVSIGGTVIVAGAPYKQVGSFANQGLSYIFDLNGNEVGIITASDGVANDNFGYSVAAACGKIVVGAPKHNSNSNSDQGAAYIYDYDGTNEVKLIASNGASYDAFGTSVAVGSGRIVVGASNDTINGIGVTGQGSVHIFDLDGNEVGIITASDGGTTLYSNYADDRFGHSVAVGSGKIVVGAYLNGIDQGAAYIYDLDGNNEVKITAPDGSSWDEFGTSVAVGSGRILVGAPLNDPGTYFNQGSVYVYDLDGNYITKLIAPDGVGISGIGDRFGHSVAVGSGRIVVGASGDNNENGTDSGAAYVYDLDGKYITKLIASSGFDSDEFGISVASGTGRIVVGAHLSDIGLSDDQGLAYIYHTPLVYTLYDAIELNYG